ncbi:Uncharacterised protein [uncultured archaeon]|nr:Uncharacterised protein [uncultured archaeon]
MEQKNLQRYRPKEERHTYFEIKLVSDSCFDYVECTRISKYRYEGEVKK